MSHKLGIEQVQQFSYSPDNKYASAYYRACHEFVDAQNKVVDYEQTNSDRTSSKYQELIKKFEYWDNRVPYTSNLAGAEEDRLAMRENEKENSGLGRNIDLLA